MTHSSVLLLDTGHLPLARTARVKLKPLYLYYKNSLVGDLLGGWSVARFHLRTTLGSLISSKIAPGEAKQFILLTLEHGRRIYSIYSNSSLLIYKVLN